jgi:prepilin-type N-terminal cleavage/methylation domain-containing protein
VSARARRLQGFTLLEVMAAVLVLGLLYSALATAAIRGLRSEGVSRRKVEASLIADRFLADLEAQLALGDIPKSGVEEQDVDIYRVGVNIQPFDPTPILDAIAAVEKERGIDARPRSGRREGVNSMELGGEAPGAPAEDLLAPPRPGADGRLRRIDVSVTWQDGEREEVVTRTTFAFDTTGLEQLFPKKGASGTGEEGADEDGDDEGTTTGRGSQPQTQPKQNQNPRSQPQPGLPGGLE